MKGLPYFFKNLIYLCFIVLVVFSCQKSDTVSPMQDNSGNDTSGMTPPDTSTMDETPPAPEDSTSAGTAPDFTLKDLGGKDVSLSDYKNKVVVLFFLGYNCPLCIAAAPDIQKKLFGKYETNDHYQILGLDQWDGDQASLMSFRNKTGVSFPLLQMASSVARNYNTTYDHLAVVDQDGNLVFVGTRGAGDDVEAVQDTVNMLLGIN